MNEWDNGGNSQCMAITKTTKVRCSLKVVKDTDFCHRHINTKEYDPTLLHNIRKIDPLYIQFHKVENDKGIISKVTDLLNERNKMLDSKYIYTLMNMYSSWAEIPLANQIFLNDEMWAIDILVTHFTNQLNNCNMENPYPIYPNNPFTRAPFEIQDLIKLKNRLSYLNISINIALKLFLNLSKNILTQCYNEAIYDQDCYSNKLANLLINNFRFRILNNKNSQGSYIGIWVPKTSRLSKFELLYDDFKNCPYQIIRRNYILPNQTKQHLQNLMESSASESYDPCDQFYCDFIC